MLKFKKKYFENPSFIKLLLRKGKIKIADPAAKPIPLPEHPRPDFEREQWINLNGTWDFEFDKSDHGQREKWFEKWKLSGSILVPFPWGSPLSGVKNEADIAWYSREISIPEEWKGKRVYLVTGASDWLTTAWLDGQMLGTHQGGYSPFEFELTENIKYNQNLKLTIRVDDAPRKFKLEGKQGYGDAKGIWQTIYLEARPEVYIKNIHFTPDIDNSTVKVKVVLNEAPDTPLKMQLQLEEFAQPFSFDIEKGAKESIFEVSIPNAKLWTLEDPFLYNTEARLVSDGNVTDKVKTYFGMRKISVTTLPGTDYPYIALNNKPVYLQLALDQAYHPDGFYTYPDDDFMRDEIIRAKKIGLNGIRIHIKVDLPRKLYWADKLGLLLMADVPNSWGKPEKEMQEETEKAMRDMFERDYNHPSIFSWVIFNETWGLKSGEKADTYTKETQEWVRSMYRLAKNLDQSRLIEDNSACIFDHVETDINSWHVYLPGYKWAAHLKKVTDNTYPGSTWNFIGGNKQSNQPLMNSECGNVWGYEGFTGDVDWSWDYHIMMNEYRRHPKVCGWLYTEHHDVVNEWNGYYRYDRSEKYTGLSDIVPNMTLNDLHSQFYIATTGKLNTEVKPGQTVEVPLFASFMTDRNVGKKLKLKINLSGWNTLGKYEKYAVSAMLIPYTPWMATELKPVKIQMPSSPCLAILSFTLEDLEGNILHKNFTTFTVKKSRAPRNENLNLNGKKLKLVRFSPQSYSFAQWSVKQWKVMNGEKMNGAGHGYFEYRVSWPKGLKTKDIMGANLIFEASAKELFGKDKKDIKVEDGTLFDYMRGEGTFDPGESPNSYPMTDEDKYKSAVNITIGSHNAGAYELDDDPADHRGILSWGAQKENGRLEEAGSYGYLISVPISQEALKEAEGNELVIRLEVPEKISHGLALYGEGFGRYPLDPTIVFELNK